MMFTGTDMTQKLCSSLVILSALQCNPMNNIMANWLVCFGKHPEILTGMTKELKRKVSWNKNLLTQCCSSEQILLGCIQIDHLSQTVLGNWCWV